MLLTVAWICTSPSWEPVVVLVGLFIGFVINDSKTSKSSENPDKLLFEKFIETLPSNGDIEFVRQFDGWISFDSEQIKQIRNFLWYWDNAEHEFADKEIEKKRKILYSAVEIFLNNVGLYTAPNHAGRQTVIPRDVDPDWDVPDHVKEEAKKLGESAQAVYQAHQDMVRTARKRLKL